MRNARKATHCKLQCCILRCNKEEEKSKAQEAVDPGDGPAGSLQQEVLGLDFEVLALRKSPAPSHLSLEALSSSSSCPSTLAREGHQQAQLSIKPSLK